MKVSKPVLYVAVVGALGYGIVVLLTPDAGTPTGRSHTAAATKTASTTADNTLPEDLNARFPRYGGPKRDGFVPRVVSKKMVSALGGKGVFPVLPPGIGKESWALTGINEVNGVKSALLESASSQGSVFLHAGDQWHGLKVASIQPDSVVFVNALGQVTRLTFTVPQAESHEKPSVTPGPMPATVQPRAAAPAQGGQALAATPDRNNNERSGYQP